MDEKLANPHKANVMTAWYARSVTAILNEIDIGDEFIQNELLADIAACLNGFTQDTDQPCDRTEGNLESVQAQTGEADKVADPTQRAVDQRDQGMATSIAPTLTASCRPLDAPLAAASMTLIGAGSAYPVPLRDLSSAPGVSGTNILAWLTARRGMKLAAMGI